MNHLPTSRTTYLAALIALTLLAGRTPAHAAAAAVDTIAAAPMQDGKAVNVAVGLHIINIASIDEVNEQFEIDGYLDAHWLDPRLTYTPAGPNDKKREYERTQVWIPYLEMVNGVTPHDRYDVSVVGDPDGSINYVERFHALLSSKFRLRRFPFDSQQLLVVIHPFMRQADEVKFSIPNSDVWATAEFTQYSSLAQWDLETLVPSVNESHLYGKKETPEVRFTIKVKRRYNFYVWKVFLPLLLMVVLSWAVFWVDARDLSNQVQIAITTILTVIAFAFAISATMPRVPYLTYIDAFFLTCYVFVFISIVELMIVHLTYRKERAGDLGVRIQRISRWAVPSAFVVTNAILVARFLG
jgi:hypothetical protein